MLRLFPKTWLKYKKVLNKLQPSYVVLTKHSNRFSTALAVKSTNPLKDDATGFYYLGKHIFGSKKEAEKHFQDRKDY